MLNVIFLLLLVLKFVSSAPESFSILNSSVLPTANAPDTTTVNTDEPFGWVWSPDEDKPEEKSKEFWLSSGQQILKESLNKKPNENVAKNLIILVADGMSIPTQTATRMFMGGEEKVLSFEEFPYVGLSKTYCVDYQVPDSSCTATAFLSGIKTNAGVLSMSGHVPEKNCSAEENPNNHVDSIFKFAQDARKSTGIVTNTRVTHATPAAAYAKSASRCWENDSQTPAGCQDLALQLIHGEIGSRLDVVLGGGYREFLASNMNDPHGKIGQRTDNRDLIREWLISRRRPIFVHDRTSLVNLNVSAFRFGEKLFGLFSESHMQYHLLNDKSDEPSLLEMTEKALQMVAGNSRGYVLMIESGRIDHGHHENIAKLALEETRHFHEVVDYVRKAVNESETLIVVTSDHSHTLSIGGEPKRKNDILSFGGFSHEDNMTYFTLSYANGAGFHQHVNGSGRVDPMDMNYDEDEFRQPATVPLYMGTHGGDDVGVYALGPYAHLFTGVYEQHYIAHAMMYATCLGPKSFLKAPACSSASKINLSGFVVVAFIVVSRFIY